MIAIVGCEKSQTICIALREVGVEAYSVDIQECSGGHPEWHIQEDILKVIKLGTFKTQAGTTVILNKIDLGIFHPPCTFLSHAGARWLYPKKGEGINKERYAKGLEAKEFFLKLLNADIPMIAVENPFPSPVYNMPEHTQIIQPFEFGHPIQKKTFLWLKNLPKLKPTKVVDCEWYYDRKGIRHTKLNGWSAKRKSKTFDKIACAMAEQWGELEKVKEE